jgi:predicted nucleic acid-binding protein
MPAGRLVDTSVVVPLLRGEPGLRERLLPARTYISTTILGELLLGALLSSRSAENLERTQRFATAVTILPCVEETARHYAEIGRELEVLGQRMPQNDQWIAAIARQPYADPSRRPLHGHPQSLDQEFWAREGG